MKCPLCESTKEIRIEIMEEDGLKLVYYRCKECGYQWDNDEILVKRPNPKV